MPSRRPSSLPWLFRLLFVLPAVDSYIDAVWERYVLPAGHARAEKRGRAVKKAATVAAVAAGAVAVAAVPLLVGVARASNLPGYS